MKEYNHIRDCWDDLENCTTYSDLLNCIGNFPNKFGKWEIDVIDESEGEVEVSNYWYDECDTDECDSNVYCVKLDDGYFTLVDD